MRTASTLVAFSFASFCGLPPIADCIDVGMIDAPPTRWVSIGPVFALLLGMIDNSAQFGWFRSSSRFTCCSLMLYRSHSRTTAILAINSTPAFEGGI